MKKKSNKNSSFDYVKYIKEISQKNLKETLNYFNSDEENGIISKQVIINRKIYGGNEFLKYQKISYIQKFIKFFFNPFNIILLLMLIISLLTDVIFIKPDHSKDFTTIIIIFLIFFLSNFISLFQEMKSSKIVEKLKKLVQTTTKVKRDNKIQKIISDDLVRGDIVFFTSGDIIPADIKLIETKNFFVQEASLTGEAYSVQKDAKNKDIYENFLEDKRLIFTGTNVISGYAKGIVIITGENTYLGNINKNIDKQNNFSNFQNGIASISKLLLIFIFFMMPLMFIINYFKNPNSPSIIMESLLFSLTIAFGLTPEMLPLITTTSLSVGLLLLSKKKVLVKNLSSIQDFGVMNILFTDKTGTLTEGHVSLDGYFDLNNNLNQNVLKNAYLNSFFHSGAKNIIDDSIISKIQDLQKNNFIKIDYHQKFHKIDEISFDYTRRMVSIILENKNNKKKTMITKGAIEEILNICDYVEFSKKNIVPLTPEYKKIIYDNIIDYNKKGFRVVGVAKKNISSFVKSLNDFDETKMILIGFLTFFDSIKKSAKKTISSLKKYGVEVKILTGDNDILTKTIAQMININNISLLSGTEIDKLDDDELYQKAKKINIFTKFSPEQKARIIDVFKKEKNIIGFMGDGINDVPAMQKAHLAISVDSGTDITKEAADIIILGNDLSILQKGIIEGRKTYTNMLKYLKFTLASNFGNVLSVLTASLFLKFMPIKTIQILFLNVVYDLTCFAIPFDNVDSNYLKKPRNWDLKNIRNFMIFFGFISFLFDLLFFFILHGESETIFQTGWFIFSMWSQVFIIYLLRTENIIKDIKPSLLMFILPITGVSVVTLSPFIPFLCDPLKLNSEFFNKFQNVSFLLSFVSILILYFIMVKIAKNIFINKYKYLL
ncbi:P-type ATPase exporting cations (probably Mg2+) [Candidatus Phytoplasma mali]|uniref:Magnesium-transporting ATPase, P-type 1 n=1 Tax=Phytoplasma mali (strain AT) TaxID=482235 RepID=B3QZW1_PHYMT|nr:magnesium-translocating P-type ATPase [Candidatus Phytoplasma mali]CAP18498.1 P-type ATPase exporting cations (probably Mg2+) [Candidatus Phytoplasma mali]